MALEPERRARLNGAKLAAIARDQLGLTLTDVVGHDDGAFGHGVDGDVTRAVTLVEQRPDRAVGRALGTARRHGADRIDIVCQVGAGLVARRLGHFHTDATAWTVTGTDLVAAGPEPISAPAEAHEAALALLGVIETSGADAVVEHGVVIGEVMGLEVARVEVDDHGPRLEVGISLDDRLMNELLHGERTSEEALAAVVAVVASHRSVGAEPHPLNRLSRERWLRALLMADPSRIELDWLDYAPPPIPRANLLDPAPAVALGRGLDGRTVVTVMSVGVDMELVPFAADARAHLAPDADLLIVVPERDAIPFTSSLTERVRGGARLMTVPDSWADASVDG